MIQVTIEVGRDAARRQVTVQAGSIPGALSLAEEHCLDGEARVVFPIEPETFFVGDRSAPSGIAGGGWPDTERPGLLA